MNEKHIKIRPKPFLLWSIGIFVLCLLPLLAFFRSEPLLEDNRMIAFIMSISVSAVAAVAGAFVVCALVQAIRGFRSGELFLSDLVAPAIVAALIGLFILGYALFPNVTGAIELSMWGICLVVWIVDAVRRAIRKKQERRTISSSILQ